MRAVTRLLTLLLALGVATLLYLAFVPVGSHAPHGFNQDRNAVWLEHHWLERPASDADREGLLLSLSRHGIRYVFPHIIPFDTTGRLPTHSRDEMRGFLSAARRVAPDMKVLPWVGGLRVGYRRQRPGSVDLANLGQRQRIVAEVRGLMDEGFDGIHLDVEPVDEGNVDFLALLRALRTAVGPGLLSLSAIRPGPVALPVAPHFFWTPEYYARVAALVDQVVVMTYDTGLPTAPLYSRYVAYATSSVTSTLVRSGSHARVLVGIPTYGQTGIQHRAGVETAENALLGVVSGLGGGRHAPFEGVALYARWTTDEPTWALYERLWRSAPP